MRHIVTLLLLLSTSLLISQNPNVKYNSNPYFESLKIYLNRLVELRVFQPGDTVFVWKRDYLSNIPVAIGELNIRVMNSDLLWKLTSKRKSVAYLDVHPIEFMDGEPMSNVVVFGVSRKGKNYKMTNNGFNDIKYIVDCNSGQVIYEVIDEH